MKTSITSIQRVKSHEEKTHKTTHAFSWISDNLLSNSVNKLKSIFFWNKINKQIHPFSFSFSSLCLWFVVSLSSIFSKTSLAYSLVCFLSNKTLIFTAKKERLKLWVIWFACLLLVSFVFLNSHSACSLTHMMKSQTDK
jgi:hypothetical protein